MPDFTLPHFGRIDPTALDEYYDMEIPFNNTQIQVDLNFEVKSIDPLRLETVKRFIENIRIHDLSNKEHILADYRDEDGDTVRFYLEHHLEELGTDDLAGLIGRNVKAADQANLLLKKLRLVRVGLYPDGESQFAIFDYSIDPELTNDLVVIFTDENGNFDGMTMES